MRGIGHAHTFRKDDFVSIFKTLNKEKIYNCEDHQGSSGITKPSYKAASLHISKQWESQPQALRGLGQL